MPEGGEQGLWDVLGYAWNKLVKIDRCLDIPTIRYLCLKVGSLLLGVICMHRLMIVSVGAHFVLPQEGGCDGIQVSRCSLGYELEAYKVSFSIRGRVRRWQVMVCAL